MKGMRLVGGIVLMAVTMIFLLAATPQALAGGDDVEALRQELKKLGDQMEALQQKLQDMEKRDAMKETELEELGERLDKAELHTATDKVSFGLEMRARADSIHYKDISAAPASVTGAFFEPYPNGLNGATLQEAQQLMAALAGSGTMPPPEEYDVDNDIIYTNKFRLNMKYKHNEQLNFAGRLAAYKVFGDSTGVKFNQGNLSDITFDGNTSSLPHGDTIRLERAYFNYKDEVGSVPINFSAGRRPSTQGAPLEYRNYSLEMGSPHGTIINWQFDGASLSFGLEEATGIPGFDIKLCYGVGFEGDWGNSYSLDAMGSAVDDVHMAGVIATLYDDLTSSAVLNYAHASDITDGFTGLTVMPFIVSKNPDGTYSFETNPGGYISRVQPATEIGDWDALSLLFRTNLMEYFADIDLFLAGSWSHTDASGVSRIPFYELMGQGLLSSNGQLEDHDGYSIYAGVLFPMPLDARLGLEYNWGSKYWFNFTGAEDSLIGSKLATRGQVFEAYYIQPIFRDNFFLTLGGQYYDYDYTGSGNPLGKPVKVSDVTSFDSLFPVLDEVWNAYLSATMRF